MPFAIELGAVASPEDGSQPSGDRSFRCRAEKSRRAGHAEWQAREIYGLYAKEARSALRVAIHMSVCCLPGVMFFFLWLYRWGHGADLQGAAVPVQLSLTLVAGYLGVLYWTR